jgi:nucleoside-diphosphate-sugar epimerase
MAALLRRGERLVVLGRPSPEAGLAERIDRLTRWFGLEALRGRVETIEADLLKPECGLDAARYAALCAKPGPIIHCASDTRFSEMKRREIVDANVHSLKGILDLAARSGAPFFHYISTAYVAGASSGLCPEALADPGEYLNVYEETKARAEREVAARLGRLAVPFTIIRPSIVYGDSVTGRATRFNALYYHVKSLQFIRDVYVNDILKHGGLKARDHGASLGDNGVLKLQLRVFLPQRGMINLIPIDYFTAAALGIMDQAEAGSVYHITSDAPKTLAQLAEYCETFLRLDGIRIIYEPPNGTLLSPPETLLNRFIEPYRPYLADARQFERRRTDRAIGGLKAPDLTYAIFERCMSYAVSVDWGNDKKSMP